MNTEDQRVNLREAEYDCSKPQGSFLPTVLSACDWIGQDKEQSNHGIVE